MTTTIRKNNRVATYIEIVDELATLARRVKQLQKDEIAARQAIIADIPACGIDVKIDGVVRTIVPEAKERTTPAVHSEELIAFADSSGLPVAERSARWIPPATFSSWASKGLLPESMIDRTTEVVLIVR